MDIFTWVNNFYFVLNKNYLKFLKLFTNEVFNFKKDINRD